VSSREQRRAEQSVPDMLGHKDKLISTFSHISKERWNEIFGNRKTTKNKKNKTTKKQTRTKT
jgi:hypothetical protein